VFQGSVLFLCSLVYIISEALRTFRYSNLQYWESCP